MSYFDPSFDPFQPGNLPIDFDSYWGFELPSVDDQNYKDTPIEMQSPKGSEVVDDKITSFQGKFSASFESLPLNSTNRRVVTFKFGAEFEEKARGVDPKKIQRTVSTKESDDEWSPEDFFQKEYEEKPKKANKKPQKKTAQKRKRTDRDVEEEAEIERLRAKGRSVEANKREKLLQRKKNNRLSAQRSRALKKEKLKEGERTKKELEALRAQAKLVARLVLPVLNERGRDLYVVQETKKLLKMAK